MRFPWPLSEEELQRQEEDESKKLKYMGLDIIHGKAALKGGESSTELVPLTQPRPVYDRHYSESFAEAMAMPGGTLEGSKILLQHYQVDAFLQAMLQIQVAAEASRRMKSGTDSNLMPPEIYTVEDMVTFQSVPIPTSLLRLPPYLQNEAVQMFQEVLRYMQLGENGPLTRPDEVALVMRLHQSLLNYPPLRDELFSQLQKQTRDNPYRDPCLKAWELFQLCLAAFPPSPVISGPLSEYFMASSRVFADDTVLNQSIMAAWSALDRSLKAGPRQFVPSAEEIQSLMDLKALQSTVFYYNGASEPILYDMTTTVSDVFQEVIRAIKLETTHTFRLYEWRMPRVSGSSNDDAAFEHKRLEGNKYIGDIFLESKGLSSQGYAPCKLLFKKRIFRDSDDDITEPLFVHMCYIQLKHDYLMGYYNVSIEIATKLAALFVCAEIGKVLEADKSPKWGVEMTQSLPRQVARSRTWDEWRTDVLQAYRALGTMSRDEAKQKSLRMLLDHPHGGSIFFHLKRISDVEKVFPEKIFLAINKKGLHFLNSSSKDLLHFADLKDILEYAGNLERIYFSITISGTLYSFEFQTNQGEEICSLLDMHIDDAVRLVDSQNAKSELTDTVNSSSYAGSILGAFNRMR